MQVGKQRLGNRQEMGMDGAVWHLAKLAPCRAAVDIKDAGARHADRNGYSLA